MIRLLFFIVITAMGMARGYSQSLVQTYVDRCTNQTYVFSVPMNGTTVVAFYNKSRTFTAQQFTNGELKAWLEETYQWWQTLSPCSTNTATNQSTQQTTNNATSSATNAASNATSGATGSTGTTGTTSTGSTNTGSTNTNTNGNTGSTESGSSSGNTGNSSGSSSSGSSGSSGGDSSNSSSSGNDSGGSSSSSDNAKGDSNNSGNDNSGGDSGGDNSNDSQSSGGEDSSGDNSSDNDTNSSDSDNSSGDGDSGDGDSSGEEGGDSSSESEESSEDSSSEETQEESSEESSDESSDEESSEESEEVEEESEEESTEEKEEEQEEEKEEEQEEESEEEESEEESEDEEKEENDKKEKKRRNPINVSANLLTQSGIDGSITNAMSFGLSQSSLTGTTTYSANAMIWDNLQQFSLSTSKSDVYFNYDNEQKLYLRNPETGKRDLYYGSYYTRGSIMMVQSLSVSFMYIYGTKVASFGLSNVYMGQKDNFWKGFVGGYALSGTIINIEKDIMIMPSGVLFGTKPFPTKRVTISPMIALALNPVSYTFSMEKNMFKGDVEFNKNLTYILGSNFDLNLSQRFKFNIGGNVIGTTTPGIPLTWSATIGSKFQF